jgi:maltose O-acetyltransferase
MLAGQLYDCGDVELITQWHKAKNLIREYNNSMSEDADTKNNILDNLLGNRGRNLWITHLIRLHMVIHAERLG